VVAPCGCVASALDKARPPVSRLTSACCQHYEQNEEQTEQRKIPPVKAGEHRSFTNRATITQSSLASSEYGQPYRNIVHIRKLAIVPANLSPSIGAGLSREAPGRLMPNVPGLLRPALAEAYFVESTQSPDCRARSRSNRRRAALVSWPFWRG
jgi:hypothetical protein